MWGDDETARRECQQPNGDRKGDRLPLRATPFPLQTFYNFIVAQILFRPISEPAQAMYHEFCPKKIINRSADKRAKPRAARNGATMKTFTTCLTLCCAIIGTAITTASAADKPVLVQRPDSQCILLGVETTFSVTATSATPLTYQWYFESQRIPDATNNTLYLTSVKYTNAGSYSVRVTNDAGYATCSARLYVTETPDLLPPGASLYKIAAGTYTEVGGIMGVLSYTLPYIDQSYLAIWTNSTTSTLQARFLNACRKCSLYPLTNGYIGSGWGYFSYATTCYYASSHVAQNDYQITFNSNGTLLLNGKQHTDEIICCDIPTTLFHSNVVARLVPTATLQRPTNNSDLVLTLPTLATGQYQILTKSTLNTNWTPIGPAITPDGAQTTITLTNTEPAAFFRILHTP
jgi:hypothetical protein